MTTIALAENITNTPSRFIHNDKPQKEQSIRRVLKLIKPPTNNTNDTTKEYSLLANDTIPQNMNNMKHTVTITGTEPKSLLSSAMRTSFTTNYCDPNLFEEKTIQRNITIPFHRISRTNNIVEVLNKELSNMLEGKCSIEGYRKSRVKYYVLRRQ